MIKDQTPFVFELIKYIPSGRILTYKQIADILQIKNPRFVGQILHKNLQPDKYPCHRVIKSDGTIALGYIGGQKQQIKKLETEGIEIKNKKISLDKFLWKTTKTFRLYFKLLNLYGFPRKWPWFENSNKPHSPDKIIIGAVLTQNTNWNNVEKALKNLEKNKIKTLDDIYKIGKKNPQKLKELIKPSGFYNQKTGYLYNLSKSIKINYKNMKTSSLSKTRSFLLSQKGIGKETADTVLLYALEKPVFVIDSYTKRFNQHFKLTDNQSYDKLQTFFQTQLLQNTKLFQNYHALIVRWGKLNT